jgi:hypothetical protein
LSQILAVDDPVEHRLGVLLDRVRVEGHPRERRGHDVGRLPGVDHIHAGPAQASRLERPAQCAARAVRAVDADDDTPRGRLPWRTLARGIVRVAAP